MSYIRLNSYTRVLDDGKKSLQQRMELFNAQSVCKSENYLKDKKRRRPENQKSLYEKFCKEIFRNKDFVCQKEFNNQILMKFNNNTTYYRKRMIELGLITEKNNLIKPVINGNNDTICIENAS
ncbi:hypothetical protein [Epilithonimonas hominis]|uniref:hypothetical protein n=1 Tax=Epilithonimonas hominis TaxID=420404 RepID=UPI00289CF7E6|nr:hypothetical protein [Epilithonimonas hominis]